MAESVVQLKAKDFDEAIAHLSTVFGQADFAALLPALYERTDEKMSCNYAVRRAGRIAAIVGLFPISWVAGGERLKLAGIGGVSVHPDFRGQGLMRVLMDAVMAEVARGGYHAACLGGNRRRYGYWGFEKAGVEASFLVTTNSVAHSLPRAGAEGLRVEEPAAGDMGRMREMYERNAVRCERSAEAFAKHLRNWRRKPVVVRDSAGEVQAYGCVDASDNSCVDVCAAGGAAGVAGVEAMLAGLVGADGKSVRVSMALVETDVLRRVAELSDDVSLIEASNWRIYDWARVVGALLRAKHGATPLLPGTCVLRAKGKAEGFRITVDGGVRCERSSEMPDFEAEAGELIRALGGPLSTGVPERAGALLRWRPLPLMIPMQDRI